MQKKNNIFILVNTVVFTGNTAAAARLRNYSKALAAANNKVIICSAVSLKRIDITKLTKVNDKIFEVGTTNFKKNKIFNRLIAKNNSIIYLIDFYRKVRKLMAKTEGNNSVLIYPSTIAFFEILGVIILKMMYNNKVYYEANEVRKFALLNQSFSRNILYKIVQILLFVISYIKYSFIELFYCKYDGIIAISTNIEKYCKQHNNNIIRIPILTGCNKKPYNSIPKFTREEMVFKIGFTGSISLKKEGFDLLYESLSELKKENYNFKLLLYGSINNMTKKILLDDLPKSLNIESNIEYKGNVESNTLMNEIQKCHLMILPRTKTYQTNYGFSTKLSEYLVSGVPVLITKVSDNGYYIKDKYNGFIIESGSKAEMTQKLKYIINNYNNLVGEIVENAFNTAHENFYYKNYSEKLSDFLV